MTSKAKRSRLFGSSKYIPVLDILEQEPITQNEHVNGVSTYAFKENKLDSFYNILSVNKDRLDQEFVSTIEAKDYPIYGVQWHPEKNAYEWPVNHNMSHSEAAITVSWYMAQFFVAESRKNNHSFASPKEEVDSLVYNYPNHFSYSMYGGIFEQIYIISKEPQSEVLSKYKKNEDVERPEMRFINHQFKRKSINKIN